MILYKYLPAARIAVLDSLLIRFTQPVAFNDPFEALPCVIGPSREAVRRRLKPGEDLEALYSSACSFFTSRGPDMILTEVSNQFGALCLAAASRDPLLWAHYADGHRGFALGFDAAHQWFRVATPPDRTLNEIQPVEYQSERPVVQVTDHFEQTPEVIRAQSRGMLFTKHVSWSYEREWRLVRELTDATTTLRADGDTVHLFSFPPAALAEVVVGARCSAATAAEIESMLTNSHFAQVSLRRATVSRSSYLLDVTSADAQHGTDTAAL